MNMNNLAPGHVIIGEYSIGELRQNSGVFDEDTGRELTNLEVISAVDGALYQSAQVYVSDKHLSPEGQSHNSALTADSAYGAGPRDEYVRAIVSQRPPTV